MTVDQVVHSPGRRRLRHRGAVIWGLVVGLLVAGTVAIAGQTPPDDVPPPPPRIDMNAAQAREEVRWGVQSYHAGRFADAIVAFTRALSFLPGDAVSREWLGRAYYRSGFEDAALAEWDIVVESGSGGAYLRSRIDTLRYRRGFLSLEQPPLSLVRSRLLNGGGSPASLFNRPVGVATDAWGDLFVVSLGSQDVARLGPNTTVRTRLQGGLQGLDRPFDVEIRNETVWVVEFGADRITEFTRTGQRLRSIGQTGLAAGSLMGPQYLAIDEDGFLYVSEWGTRRVSKFAPDGEFVLTIGTPSASFAGLARPTGVAVRSGTLYVAEHDREGVALQTFDLSGNHLARIDLPLGAADLPASSISGVTVEDLGWYDEQTLLISAGRRVLLFDPLNEAVVAVLDDGERQRVSAAAVDANGRIAVGDIDANQVAIFEPEGSLYSGLDVEIERILVRDYPRVGVLVSVHDRNGRPLVGLSQPNFIISENGIPMADAEIESAGNTVDTGTAAIVLVPGTGADQAALGAQAASDLASALAGSFDVTLVAAGAESIPVIALPATSERVEESAEAVLARLGTLARTGGVALDRVVRLTATRMLTAGLRRDIIVVGDGAVPDDAFLETGLQELGAFLLNNGIRLHLVMTRPGAPAPEYDYLIDETGGTVRYLFEPEGVLPLREDLLSHPSGRYWLTYTSRAPGDFGRAYLTVAAEARLFVRSGRDELGFYAPETP